MAGHLAGACVMIERDSMTGAEDSARDERCRISVDEPQAPRIGRHGQVVGIGVEQRRVQTAEEHGDEEQREEDLPGDGGPCRGEDRHELSESTWNRVWRFQRARDAGRNQVRWFHARRAAAGTCISRRNQ
ncbi:hypothetical protein AN217_01905 [Streptomyces qinglanensis]|uniref:Uncharacterized protein n=1 Tax=Streptomyces qinglanensis TaxID=943816 RepID=A0A1E7KDP7_9ACTN|nr:hypothetical protein AN217_01905 [Streptomyces qinglanensis]OEV24070.1 hypothetical protein AN220_21035 [Streptomyces nanshensis]